MMNINEEIKELELALELSPENVSLRRILIKKMRSIGGYAERIEFHLQYLINLDANDLEAKETLMLSFFENGKNSACIIIGEELYRKADLSTEGMIVLAKAYLKDGDQARAKEIYQEVIIINPAFKSEELDKSFRMGVRTNDDETSELPFMEKPKLKFDDIGGLDLVKREIDLKIIKPMQFQDLYASYGKKAGGGILLYGPPGCGKTYLAKATAGEINAGFINVTLNDILDMWVGNSEKNLNRIFETARQYKPCVIFFDEVDALGSKRSDMRQSAGKNVINQFLSEMDGVASDNAGVLMVGATNVPWHLDAAFRRPGRFDRIIFIPPPDEAGREAILKIQLKDKPISNIDAALIAKHTPFYSGADLNAIIDVAVERIIEHAMNTGVARPIETKDLLDAIRIRKASTLEWFTTAKNYATFANQSGQYDEVLKYITNHKL